MTSSTNASSASALLIRLRIKNLLFFRTCGKHAPHIYIMKLKIIFKLNYYRQLFSGHDTPVFQRNPVATAEQAYFFLAHLLPELMIPDARILIRGDVEKAELAHVRALVKHGKGLRPFGERKDSGKPKNMFEPISIRARPLAMYLTPYVDTNAGIFTTPTRNPLTNPNPIPTELIRFCTG